MKTKATFSPEELHYLRLLAKKYPTVQAASTEIINLQSILHLPKGTEHFLTDIHGEYEQFNHVLKNGSGAIRRKIDEEFGNTLSEKDKKALATLIYYPEEKLALISKEEENLDDWYKITLHRLVQITKRVSSKYTRSKVRKALPKDFAYVIEELITEKAEVQDKEGYYNEIIHTIIRIGRPQEFIIALANLIQRLVVDHLHIVGDIFDRGPGPHIIMDTLMAYHSVDVQWGNHDICWIGAASGSTACIANVIRIAAKYGNLDTLEEGYGINLVPLATFAMETYADTDCSAFTIKYNTDYNTKDLSLDMKMHKAITMILFKLEGQKILRNPSFGMEDRLLLDKIDYENKCITIHGKTYPMLDTDFPTVDPKDPYTLTPEAETLIATLTRSFRHSEKLQRHIRFLYSKGSLYKVYNNNLLLHGCVPMGDDGELLRFSIGCDDLSGKEFLDYADATARRAYYNKPGSPERQFGMDFLWWLWCGRNSPIFGRDRMTTFERRFIADEDTWTEPKNAYYTHYKDPAVCERLLGEFGLEGDHCHIINGHVPVKSKKGESPIKGGGKLLVIDGGFSKAYQPTSGIAGYTLIFSSRHFRIVSHQPFEGRRAAISSNHDIANESQIFEKMETRMKVAETDEGTELQSRVDDLTLLLQAYQSGAIAENH